MIGDLKHVNYDKYCEKCKYFKQPDYEDPCDECMDNPVNQDSYKPIKFEEKEHGTGKTH
jgi:hypothetical protein